MVYSSADYQEKRKDFCKCGNRKDKMSKKCWECKGKKRCRRRWWTK